ncbi:hypothetical protein BDV96DRAFT_531527 [Lophiotrema nucula]|uniref:LRRK2 ANK repeat domain-containing protein n=1 Tax=Lophiotrema nucula TaxID=690887 RepID=A0A6A5YLA2_9PLEO|nr:hypothetical protein BDV96DRAFT_531527 [Lophiotrema nucula]
MGITILDLPLELFQSILYHAIQTRGLERGLRLRLVNTTFNKAVVQTLFIFRLLDSHFESLKCRPEPPLPSFAASYLEYRVLNESESGISGLLCIRRIAEQLSNESTDGRKFHAYIQELCSVTMQRSGYAIVKLFSPAPPAEDDFGLHLFVAAVCTNTIAPIKAGIAKGHSSYAFSWIFGDAQTHAMKNGNYEFLAQTLSTTDGVDVTRRCQMFRRAIMLGSLEIASYTFNFGINDSPWNISENENSWFGPCSRDTLVESITPNVQVWNFVRDLRKKYLGHQEPSQIRYTAFLERCAHEGWADMASSLLTLGAQVNSLSYDLSRLIITACKKGHMKVVETLLTHGADTRAAVEAASQYGHTAIVELLLRDNVATSEALEKAVAGGYRDIVILLFDHNNDLGKAAPASLPYTIQQEHVQMFELLMDRNETSKQKIREDCLKRAQTLGLESMLDLLHRRGWVA